MKSLSNKFMHLTNYSINKKNEGAYQANSDETVCQGHKWYVSIALVKSTHLNNSSITVNMQSSSENL